MNPCDTSAIVDPAVADISLGLLETDTRDFASLDTASNTYGALDGVTLCGVRTYTYVY